MFRALRCRTDIQAELRDYQCEGFSWTQFLAERGLGGVLADDMGLGKPCNRSPLSPCANAKIPAFSWWSPTSVVDNWYEEVLKFIPDMPVFVHLGLDEPRSLKTAEQRCYFNEL